MLNNAIIYLFIVSNFTALSAIQSQNISSLSSRSSIDKELEQDYQRRGKERQERDRKLEEAHEKREEEYQRREKEREARKRRLEEADQRREKEREDHIRQIRLTPKHPNHAVILSMWQATQDFQYLKSNHKALINNYKKILQKHGMQLQGKSYTLLDLVSKFSHISTYEHQYYSYEEKDKRHYNRKVAFYIGTEGLSMQCREITTLRKKVKDLIADEMNKPSSKTKKAKRAFNYLKKKAKIVNQAIEHDSVSIMLALFKARYEALDFKHTQTGIFVLPYSYLIELAKIVKSYQKRAKSIQS